MTRQVATLRLRAGALRVRARVAMTPAGLVATGVLVSSVLLSTAAVVRAAGHTRRAALPKKDDPPALGTLREDT